MDELENMYADKVLEPSKATNRQAVATCRKDRTIDYQREYAQSIQFENEKLNQSRTVMHAETNRFVVVNHIQLSEQSLHWWRDLRLMKPYHFFL
jgi:hypothetical protein